MEMFKNGFNTPKQQHYHKSLKGRYYRNYAGGFNENAFKQAMPQQTIGIKIK